METKPAYVTFKQAKLAKEKGFDIPTKLCFTNEPDSYPLPFNAGNDRHVNSKHLEYISAPTQSALQKWLREIHNIDISIIADIIDGERGYECWIINKDGKEIQPLLSQIIEEKYGTLSYELKYEEALEKGLQEALKLIP
jgi:hypothetical protein